MREELVQRFDREVSDSEFGRIAGMLKVGIVIGGTTFGIAAAAFAPSRQSSCSLPKLLQLKQKNQMIDLIH